MALCDQCFREKGAETVCPFCGYDPTGWEKKHPLALRPQSILNGRYIVGRVLGQGGFGITYIALDYQAKERVAVKEYFPTEFAGRTGGTRVQIYSEEREQNFAYGKAQFLEEARTLAAVTGSENIVRVHSYFEENGTAYFTMDYVEGLSLDQFIRRNGGPLTAARAAELLLPLMGAMDTVHRKGIVHRDIAPDNIIITPEGKARLIDFGAARYSTGEKSKSLDVILKHGFAPMEQYTRRGRQGPWTDVYAMAATYYYALTGEVPPDAIERIAEDTLELPSAAGSDLSAGEERVLLKALAVQAPDRWQNMGEFRAAMQAVRDAADAEALHADRERRAREEKERLAREKAEQAAREKQEKAAREAQKKAEREAAHAARQTEREAAHAAKQAERKTRQSAGSGAKKSRLPLVLAAVLVLALGIFGATRFIGKSAPAVTATPAATEAAAASAPEAEPVATPEPIPAPVLIRQVAAGGNHTAALLENGLVVAVGDNSDGQCDTESWRDIVAIAAGSRHTLGLKADGTVVAVGKNTYGQCDVQAWADVTAIRASAATGGSLAICADGSVRAAGAQYVSQSTIADWKDVVDVAAGTIGIVGLRSDGRVRLAESAQGYGGAWDGIDAWRDLVSVAAGTTHLVGLKSNGTVLAVNHTTEPSHGECNVSAWEDIAAVYAGDGFTIGMRADGSLAATGRNTYGQCDVTDWTEVEQLSAGSSHTVALRRDGTLLATGYNYFGQCDMAALMEKARAAVAEEAANADKIVSIAAGQFSTLVSYGDGTAAIVGYNVPDLSGWRNVRMVSAGFRHYIGLLADGTVVAVGDNSYGQCDVSGWKNICAVAAAGNHSLGLTADGTVVATGENIHGQCDVKSWKDIVSISTSPCDTVGLKKDGTLVIAGYYSSQFKEASADWHDLVVTAAGGSADPKSRDVSRFGGYGSAHIAGLHADGSVSAVGGSYYRECSTTGWSDVTAVCASSWQTVGLKSDGTVVATGDGKNGRPPTPDWTEITAISLSDSHLIGLRKDGTIAAVGENRYGQCDVDALNRVSP